jgi:hypothetical protein
MSNGLPLLSLRQAQEPDPFETLRQIPAEPTDPYAAGPPAQFGFQPEAYVPERARQMAPPSFGRQLLEGLADAIGGSSIQPGPRSTFRSAGPGILGLLAAQLLTGPIRRGAREREELNAYLKQEAERRREEGAETRKGGREAWQKYIEAQQAASIAEKEQAARFKQQESAFGRESAFKAGESQKDRDAAMARLAKEIDAANKRAELAAKTKGANRPSTGLEKKALGFYNTGRGAIDLITRVPEGGGQSLEERIGLSGMATFATKLPNWMQSGEVQQYVQAQRSFTEARLRQVSGSAINASEYDNDAKMFFAQPGDEPATILQKQFLREKVLDGLKFQSGPAYFEYYGAEGSPVSDFSAPAPPETSGGIPDDEAYEIWREVVGN